MRSVDRIAVPASSSSHGAVSLAAGPVALGAALGVAFDVLLLASAG
ncbi:hypothetical protein AA0Z99_00125 [Agrococcus sp. 1P02AA]